MYLSVNFTTHESTLFYLSLSLSLSLSISLSLPLSLFVARFVYQRLLQRIRNSDVPEGNKKRMLTS